MSASLGKEAEVEVPSTLYLKSKKKLFYLQRTCQADTMTDL